MRDYHVWSCGLVDVNEGNDDLYPAARSNDRAAPIKREVFEDAGAVRRTHSIRKRRYASSISVKSGAIGARSCMCALTEQSAVREAAEKSLDVRDRQEGSGTQVSGGKDRPRLRVNPKDRWTCASQNVRLELSSVTCVAAKPGIKSSPQASRHTLDPRNSSSFFVLSVTGPWMWGKVIPT